MANANGKMNEIILSDKEFQSLSFHMGRINKILVKHSSGNEGQFNFDNLNRQEKIDYIIRGVCTHYGISKDFLGKQGVGSNAEIWIPRRLLCLLFYEYTDANFKEIAKILGFKTHAAVVYHYNRVKEELSSELYGTDKTKLMYHELIKHLML